MSITTPQEEYKRLRQYLSSYIRGPNTDAVLNAIASSMSTYLVNNAAAVNDSLHIKTAQGQFLDLLLGDFGITRDPTVGLGDDVFRALGIQIKNRKQVRDLINNILDIIFGDKFAKTTSDAQRIEPYALQDGDTLVINFDGTKNTTITFKASQFTSIAAATAQEVANAISVGLSSLGVSGSATQNNDGNGNYVQLLSDTIGASSSITVMGGRAQNVLLFKASVPTFGNFSTQWTLSLRPGGNVRFTWSGGADPQIGVVEPHQYVNVFGGGFASSPNEGSFPIVSAHGGAVNVAYFEINNPLGSAGVIVQGTDSAVLFFTPIRETLLSKQYYAAVYSTQTNLLQIFMPATTQVIKRSRIGSMHLHGTTEQPVVQLKLLAGNTFPTSGSAGYYLIDDLGSAFLYYVWYNVAGGSNTDPAPAGFTGIQVNINSSDSAPIVASKTYAAVSAILPTLTYDVENNIVNMTVTDPSTIADTGPSLPTTLGPYVFDTQQGFSIGNGSTTLTEDINSQTNKVITVGDSSQFPDSSGYIVLGYGTDNQEVVPYIARPSNGTILISPAYFIQQDHPIGTSVLLVAQKSPIVLRVNGSDYQGYLTDTASGRVYAQNLIESVVAAGVTVNFTILYPNPIGLAGWENPSVDEVAYVYGP